jgi:hypothetical protein
MPVILQVSKLVGEKRIIGKRGARGEELGVAGQK